MAEKISVEIALEGGKEVERQLKDIGDAGQKAFADIKKSAEQAGGFKNLEPDAVTNKLEQFGVTGVEAINKIKAAVQSGVQLESLVQGVGAVEAGFAAVGTAAVAVGIALGAIALVAIAAGAALLPLVSSAAQASDALARVADSSNSSMQAVSNLANVFAETGTSLEQFSSTIGKLAEDSNRAFESMAAGAQQAADRISQAEQRVEDAHNRARDAAQRQREAEAQRSIQMEQSAVASERSALASNRAAAAQAGLTKEYSRSFAIQEEQIRGHERYVSSLQSKLNAMRADGEASRNAAALSRAWNEEERASHELAQVRANDLQTLAKAWSQFSQGIVTNFDPLAKFESKVQALKLALGEITARGGDLTDQMRFLASIFSKLPVDKAYELGKALGLSRSEISELIKGVDDLDARLARQRKLDLGLNEQDRKNLEDFSDAWNRLSNTISQVARKIGALVAPAFTAIFNGLTIAIEGAILGVQTLVSWLGKLAQTPVGQLLITMFNILVTVIGTVVGWLFRLSLLLLQIAALPAVGTLVTAFYLLNGAISLVVAGISTLFSWLAQLSQTPVGQALAAGFNLIGGAIAIAIDAVSRFVSWLSSITWDSISSLGVAAWNAIVATILSAVDAVTSFASSIATIVWDSISSLGVAAWNALKNAILAAIAALLTFLGLQSRAGGVPSGSPAGGKASGGLLGGRGTGTSDSNLAWVSRGEHIMPARAVAQPGVLAFLEALRRSGGNLSRVLDGMGRFALGGMIRGPMPAFASGGLAGGMSNVTIQFPGLPDIGGLRASASTVDELRRAAALAQVRSGGRKPSRYS